MKARDDAATLSDTGHERREVTRDYLYFERPVVAVAIAVSPLRISLPDSHGSIQFVHNFEHLQPQVRIDLAGS